MDDDTTQGPGFEASLVKFFERVASQPSDDATPEFHRLLGAHFDADPAALAVVTETFAAAEHANLHVALEAWLAEPGREAELVGMVSEHMQYTGIGLAQLASPSRGSYGSPSRGPVQYANLRTGPDEVLPCVQLGLYLVRDGETPLAILVRGPNEIGYNPAVTVEVMARDNALADRVLADLRRAMRRRSVYRGHVVSLGLTAHNAVEVTFHTLPEIARDQIILPEGLLDRIERHTVRFSAHAERLRAAGRHLKRGLLLHGPPGAGKTLTAMYLASQMRDRTVLLLTGRGFGLLDYTCRMARALAPSMVVLEDVDLIAEERTREGRCGALLFELLNEMDGLADDTDVLFLLTTNRPDILEPALAARPGRVDQAIEVPLPDAACRRRLFELYGRGLDVRVDDLDRFIARTEGASGAFVRELLRKAALAAADESDGELVVADRHVDEALRELVVDGGELTRSLLGARVREQ
jgi:hypothetical protein